MRKAFTDLEHPRFGRKTRSKQRGYWSYVKDFEGKLLDIGVGCVRHVLIVEGLLHMCRAKSKTGVLIQLSALTTQQQNKHMHLEIAYGT